MALVKPLGCAVTSPGFMLEKKRRLHFFCFFSAMQIISNFSLWTRSLLWKSTLLFLCRSNQPRLGVGTNNTYLFEDDPGIMSEIETSSTRFRKPHRGENHRPPPAASSGAATRLPRTSPKSYTNSALYDEDPGIMSEAETASTTRGKRSSSRNNSIPSMGYKSQHGSQRSVQFRYPVVQFHTPSASMFDDDPGIMSEADTSSTSGKITS